MTTNKNKSLILFIFFILLMGVNFNISAQSDLKFHHMTYAEIDELIREMSGKSMTVTQRMNYYSLYFLGMPYNFKCVGDGPYALFEPWPLVNFKETNCMAFCEHVLALAISDNWDHFFNNLQQIRYRNGIIGIKTRNHYTLADWLPQNGWLLKDVSAEIGGNYTQKVTRTISHKHFFLNKGITDTSQILPDRVITVNYIPLDDFQNVLDQIQTGDILTLLFANINNIFSAHMVIVAETEEGKIIRESSNSKMKTFDTPIKNWIIQKINLNPQRYLGITVIRVKDKINKSGKIIYPSQIQFLKGIN